MKLTGEMLFEINNKLQSRLNVDNSIKGASVYDLNWELCTLDELDEMITRLMEVKIAVEEATGIVI